MSKEQVFDRSKYISGIDPYDKKEKIEEAAERIWLDSTSQLTSKNSFIAGAKWQQEQMEKLKDFDTWKEWKNKTE